MAKRQDKVGSNKSEIVAALPKAYGDQGAAVEALPSARRWRSAGQTANGCGTKNQSPSCRLSRFRETILKVGRQVSNAQPFQESEELQAPSKYAPISSVWEGTDGELLDAILNFYPVIPVKPILDATYNKGRIWIGSKQRDIVTMDIDPSCKPMIVGDNRKMVDVPSANYGVVVYDPPHVGPQGRDKSCKKFDVDFGATVECGKKENWSLSYLYPPFLEQAKRVLKPEGLLLAKITDMVNNHRSKWAHCDFMRMAEEAGFTVCDLIIKVRTGPMLSNKWQNAHHARKRHCFWIVCRNGDDCEGPLGR